MKEYHKINSIFKRDQKTGKFILRDYADPIFEYLKNNQWTFTEKVDGTNVRVYWDSLNRKVSFGGRTDSAQMPVFLMERLKAIFPEEKLATAYPEVSMTLYGEGYGAKIQKGGGNYKPDGQDFVLFDVLIGEYWLERENVNDIGNKLGLSVVPLIGAGTLDDAIAMCEKGFNSTWGSFESEGIVLRPSVELKTRGGHRIITKVKCRDFK